LLTIEALDPELAACEREADNVVVIVDDVAERRALMGAVTR
jgi:hypothetical protein